MGRNFVALLSGTLFGFGLALSGMMNPTRVRGFLDVLGDWDPTLAFVMGGAVLVMALAWAIQGKLHKPVVCENFSLPGTKLIDAKLIGGAAIFGIGWAIAGLCPGPAIASLANDFVPALIFVVAMIVGMLAYSFTQRNA